MYIVTESYEKQAIQKNLLACFQEIIKLALDESELQLAHKEITRMYHFVAKHPVFLTKAPALEKAEQYCRKVRDTFKRCEFESANDEEIAARVIAKLKSMLVF